MQAKEAAAAAAIVPASQRHGLLNYSACHASRPLVFMRTDGTAGVLQEIIETDDGKDLASSVRSTLSNVPRYANRELGFIMLIFR